MKTVFVIVADYAAVTVMMNLSVLRVVMVMKELCSSFMLYVISPAFCCIVVVIFVSVVIIQSRICIPYGNIYRGCFLL